MSSRDCAAPLPRVDNGKTQALFGFVPSWSVGNEPVGCFVVASGSFVNPDPPFLQITLVLQHLVAFVNESRTDHTLSLPGLPLPSPAG